MLQYSLTHMALSHIPDFLEFKPLKYIYAHIQKSTHKYRTVVLSGGSSRMENLMSSIKTPTSVFKMTIVKAVNDFQRDVLFFQYRRFHYEEWSRNNSFFRRGTLFFRTKICCRTLAGEKRFTLSMASENWIMMRLYCYCIAAVISTGYCESSLLQKSHQFEPELPNAAWIIHSKIHLPLLRGFHELQKLWNQRDKITGGMGDAGNQFRNWLPRWIPGTSGKYMLSYKTKLISSFQMLSKLSPNFLLGHLKPGLAAGDLKSWNSDM